MNSLAECRTKVAKLDFIKGKLATDDRWLLRGLLAIYKKQTEDEQRSSTTKEHNGVGFSGIDGELMSSFAQRVLKQNGDVILRTQQDVDASQFFSQKQLDLLKPKMQKYAKQLLTIAENQTKISA